MNVNGNQLAVKVLPNIWLGSFRAAESKAFFEKENIKAVINVTPNVPNYFNFNPDVEYLRIPTHDSEKLRCWYTMYQYFPISTEFIYKNVLIEKKNILIHCSQGFQRAPTILAAYLIKFYEMTTDAAINHVLKYKSDSFHGGKFVNFSQSLKKWRTKYE